MFHLSRPAYAAVFELVPWSGVRLLSAQGGATGMYAAGWNRLRPSFAPSRTGYHFTGMATGTRPRFLFLIVAEEPLQVGRYLYSALPLRSDLGVQRFASSNPYALMEDLADLVLPVGYTGEWTTDVFVDWPEPRNAADLQQQYVSLRCESGRVITVPLEHAKWRGEFLDVLCRDLPRDTVPRDSTGVDRERPDRPEPRVRPVLPETSQELDRPVRPPRRPELEEPEVRPAKPDRPGGEIEPPSRPEPPARPERPEPPSRPERSMRPAPAGESAPSRPAPAGDPPEASH